MTARKPPESSAPIRIVLADASKGTIGEAGGFATRFGVTGSLDPDDGTPVVRPEDEVQLDPRQVRIHDIQKTTPEGLPDRRAQIQTVNDFDAEYADARPGDAGYRQREEFTSQNRSTRIVDGQGRVALPASLERNLDSEDGRYARSLTLNEFPLEGPSSELGAPDATSGAPQGPPPPPGVTLLDAGTTTGTGGTVTRAHPGVSVQGLMIDGAEARAAAEAAISAGGNAQDVARWAMAAKMGRKPPPIQGTPPAPDATKAAPEPPAPTPPAIPAARKPGGYVAGVRAGQTHVGLLGTAFVPTAGEPIFLGKEGTPIGTLPLRRDVQVATSYDRRGAFLIVDDDVADVPESVGGRLVKGWLAHDSSKAGQDTALPGETHKLRPVMRIDASQIPPPADPPPPYIDPEREKRPKDDPQDGPTPLPNPGTPVPPGPGRGPGNGAGRARPPGDPPPPPARGVVAVRDAPFTFIQPQIAGTPTGLLATPVTNPQAQGRDFSAPGVPCPNATGGRVLTGTAALSGGATGTPPSAPVVSTGHPAVVHTGEELVIGPAGFAGGGAVGAAAALLGGVAGGAAGGASGLERPATAADLAQGTHAPWLQDRFVGKDGKPVSPHGFDPVADHRVPLDELDAAIPVSAFPKNRQAIVRVRRAAAARREAAETLKRASETSGVERRRVQNDRDNARNLADIARRRDDVTARRAAAQAKKPPDQRTIDRMNRELARLGKACSDELDRFARQRARLDRSQAILDGLQRRAAAREKAKAEAAARRAARATKPQGGMPVAVTPHPLADAAAVATGWIGPEEAAARGRAAASDDADGQRDLAVNAGLSPEGRAALGLPPLAASSPILDSVPGNEAAILAAGGFGSQNILTVPAPIFGEPGGPASVVDILRILGAQVRAIQGVLGGAFGGPTYLASNLAVQHENAPGNPPASSTIASRWAVAVGEKLTLTPNTPTLEVRSTVVAAPGGQVAAPTGAVLQVVKENAGAVQDKRAIIFVEERVASRGGASGGEAIAVGAGDGWAVTPTGETKHRLEDGSYWSEKHESDNSLSKRKVRDPGTQVRTGGFTATETGILSTVDETGGTGPALDAAAKVVRTPDLEGATTVAAGDPGYGISDGLPVYVDSAGDVHNITAGGGGGTSAMECPPLYGGSGMEGDVTRATGSNLEISDPYETVNLTMQGSATIRVVAGYPLDIRIQGDFDASTCDTGKISGDGRAGYTNALTAGGNGTAGSNSTSANAANGGAAASTPALGSGEGWAVGGSFMETPGGGGGGSGGADFNGGIASSGNGGAGAAGIASAMTGTAAGTGGNGGAGVVSSTAGNGGSTAGSAAGPSAAYRTAFLAGLKPPC